MLNGDPPVGLTKHVGQFACDVAEWPVFRVGRDAEERKCQKEKVVSDRKVQDVIVADRTTAYCRVPASEHGSAAIYELAAICADTRPNVIWSQRQLMSTDVELMGLC